MVTINPANNATAATGKVLQGAGVGTASTYSTATYPATAGTSGNVLTSDGTNWASSAAPAGNVKQQIRANSVTSTTASTTIPADDTIPQNTEGTQILTASITPTNTNSVLVIEITIPWGGLSIAASGSAVTRTVGLALFQDATANALAATSSQYTATGTGLTSVFGATSVLTFYKTAGTTSSTTFNARIGADSGSIQVNGVAGAARLYGGVQIAAMTITEYSS